MEGQQRGRVLGPVCQLAGHAHKGPAAVELDPPLADGGQLHQPIMAAPVNWRARRTSDAQQQQATHTAGVEHVGPPRYRTPMSFDVDAAAYDAFMGRWSRLLSAALADAAGIVPGMRVLDVGCGTGALTDELVRRVGARGVAAIDPSVSFVHAMRDRFPGVDVREASAEQLPFSDGGFDATLAQLVVHFLRDPIAGLAEMRRVTRPGGVVVACVWDYAGNRGPLGVFWDAAREIRPDVRDESRLAGTRDGHLRELFEAPGCGTSRRRSSTRRSSTPRSTSGESHSRRAPGPPARSSPAWTRTRSTASARSASAGWLSARSRSGPPPGLHAATRDRANHNIRPAWRPTNGARSHWRARRCLSSGHR